MSRRWKIVLAIVLLIPVLVVGIGYGIVAKSFGTREANKLFRGVLLRTRARRLNDHTFERTPERLERGRYLAEGVAGCMNCHSEQDAATGEPLPGKLGVGQVLTDEEVPFPMVFPNITADEETGAGLWTDDMLARAIREGVGHDGRPLMPVMLYENFRHMSDEDVAAVVVYLRSLPPVRNRLPKQTLPFPSNLLVKAYPEPLAAPVSPPAAEPVARGEYLVHLGDCANCHRARDAEGNELPFGGGGLNTAPDGKTKVAAANITFDPSGISYYDEELFIAAMRTGRVRARALSSAMPWRTVGKLTDDDLKAIFAYLRTVKPVQHRVDNAEPAALCKLCGQTHGGGGLN